MCRPARDGLGRGRPWAAPADWEAHPGWYDPASRKESEGAVKLIRYAAAACQTDLPNPIGRLEMRANTDRMLSMIDSAVAGAAPFLPSPSM